MTLFSKTGRTIRYHYIPGEKESPIKHIVFISKENRTYDEVFGQIKKGNGDSTIARYGRNAKFFQQEQNRLCFKYNGYAQPSGSGQAVCHFG